VKFLRVIFALGLVGWGCAFCLFVFLPNLAVAATLADPGVPDFFKRPFAKWQLDIPQDSDGVDSSTEVRAGTSRIKQDGYTNPDFGPPSGVPLHGPVMHWSQTYDKPLLGCEFQDPNYISHIGDDFPVNSGTPVYATMSGKVIWVGDNGDWGNLVVVEANGYQTWFAHNESFAVQVGDIVQVGQVLAHSGSTGHSSGPHVHYGIKHFKDASDQVGVWLNPEQFFSLDDVTSWPCGD
jgi:murein DD-endopeptidase MepM/ murein hydrolase activator NlpD